MSAEGREFDYRDVLAASPAMLVVVSPDFTILEASDTYLAATHKDRSSIGRPLFDVFNERPGDPEATDRLGVRGSLEKVLRTKKTSRVSSIRYDVQRADGGFDERYWNLTSSPVLDTRGEVQSIVHFAEEVTGEVMLERREAAILESFTDAFFAIDRDWRFTYVNAQAESLLGRQPGDLIGQSLWEAFPGLAGSEFETMYRRTATELVSLSTTAYYPDHQRWYEVHTYPGIPDGITIYFRNVTERVLADETLRESEERFRKLADRTPVLIWISGPDSKAIWFNQPWLEFTGRTMDQELGYGWAEGMHPEDLPIIREAFAGPFAQRARYALLYRLRRRDGEYRWIQEHGVPTSAADGSFSGYVGSCFDITPQIQTQSDLESRVAERTRELEETIRESEGFNYSVAHDLRAPLRAIASTSRILLDELGPELHVEHRELLNRQAHNASRLGRLIDELLRLSRLARVEVKREKIDMTEKFRSVAADVDADRKVEVQEGMEAEADRELLRTVVENLLGNAFKFSEADSVVYVGQTDGAFWVRDEGVGFDMQYASKLFLPFERLVTESEFPGTGIGLANVERILRRHEGRVWAESEPGRGATFFFTLENPT